MLNANIFYKKAFCDVPIKVTLRKNLALDTYFKKE